MRILIIGGSGMLGHELWRHLHVRHDVWVLLRRPAAEFRGYGLFDEARVQLADVNDFARVEQVVTMINPQAVLNCVGIIKQMKEAKSPIPSIQINALLPHRLAEMCQSIGARLVHFSTDCVFSGRKGNYIEADPPDAEDLYGRTKLLGEVVGMGAITLRTSIIGRELGTKHSLIDWFLSQNGSAVKGFRRAIYSGFTTTEMARIVELVLSCYPVLNGLWQVSSNPINKYELLCLVREKFGMIVEVTPDDNFVCDRSLDSARFRAATGYLPPSWNSMIAEMAELHKNYQV